MLLVVVFVEESVANAAAPAMITMTTITIAMITDCFIAQITK